MLNSISWQEFISTITLLIGGYYVITVLLLYSKEITNIFKQKKLNITNTNARENQTDSNESIELMGDGRRLIFHQDVDPSFLRALLA